MNFEWKPGDIILFENMESWLPRKIKEFFLESRYGHVSIFFGAGYTTGSELVEPYNWNPSIVPLHIEAVGRGVLKTD
ncbi:MAG: hypothetical protein PHG61_03290, partial [Candidatus Marinimicrobia bacterium]|nr:hypothetical protein [Candidatus Neomarinimicrobiota bacterium]